MGFSQPVRGTAQRALLADLVADERREEAFGAFRVVLNAGATLGPVLGAALVSWSWEPLFAGITVAFALSSLAALRLPESSRRPTTTWALALGAAAARGPRVSCRLRGDDGRLVHLQRLRAADADLPDESHGLEPATWGLLYAMNPIVIVALQLRVTRWTSSASRGARLAAGVLLMGMLYFALEVNDGLAVVVAVLLVVVLGEMLWAPASEALVAGIAPPGLRGVYLGTAANAASWAGMASAPAIGLQARAAFSERGMWLLVASIAVTGAALYLLAARRAQQESPRDRSSLRHADPADAGRCAQAIATAVVGDEQKREDPTVTSSSARAAELLGQEEAVFLPTATMANQIALRLHGRARRRAARRGALAHPHLRVRRTGRHCGPLTTRACRATPAG